MGAQNVAKVFANWRHLSHREARALLFMANMALDADKPPVYFGGWAAVAEALGLSDAASARRMTMQVFAALRAAGATVSSGQARINVRAEYALALEPEFTFEPKGSGRSVAWVKVPRESVANPREDGDRVHEKDTQSSTKKTPIRVYLKCITGCTKKTPLGVLRNHREEYQMKNIEEYIRRPVT